MTPIDWAIIAVYLAGCTAAGLWMQRYVRNVADFAIAGRELEVNLGVTSLAATEVGIVTVVYTAEAGFTLGLGGATFGILSAAAILVVGLTGFVIVPLRKSGVMTIPELLEKRFGTRVRWLAGLVIILGGLLNMGVFLRTGGEFLMHVTGVDLAKGFDIHLLGLSFTVHFLELMMTGLLAIVLIYTVLGGMLSVLMTDYLQFLVKGTGIIVVSVVALWWVPWSTLISHLGSAYQSGQAPAIVADAKGQVDEVTESAAQIEAQQGPAAAQQFMKEKFEAVSKELAKSEILVDTEAVVKPTAKPAKPLTMAHPFNPFKSKGWGWVLWQGMTAIAMCTTWQTMISRVLSARDAHTAKGVYRGCWFYFAGRWCLPGLWGAAAFVYFTSAGGLPSGTPANMAMAEFLKVILPTGLIGVVLAAMLAAEMSTDSGYLLTWATVIYNDLIMPCLRRSPSAAARLRIIRSLVLAIGIFLVFWGLWYQMPGSVWEYLQVTGNIYLASLFALLVGALYWKGANAWGAYSAIILGAAGPITFLIVNAIVPEESPYHIPGEVSGLAAFGLAFAAMIIGSLVGQATGRAKTVPLEPNAEEINL